MAQCAHVAAESAEGTTSGTHVVVLAIESEARLLKYHRKLEKAGVRHIVFVEPDLENQATAIGIFPVSDREPLRRILGHLPLFGYTQPTQGTNEASGTQAHHDHPGNQGLGTS